MDGKPVRRNKAAFLNFNGVVWTVRDRARNGGLYIESLTAPLCVCVPNRVILVVYMNM